MTDLEKIAFRDKARKDFEGKEINGEVIYQVCIDLNNGGNVISLRDSNDFAIVSWFPLEGYDSTLYQCKKPFPKEGFNLTVNGGVHLSKAHDLCEYVRSHYGMDDYVINGSLDNYSLRDYPQIKLGELKDEAKRIIESL